MDEVDSQRTETSRRSSSPGYTFGTVTDKISAIVLTRPTSDWLVHRLRHRLPAHHDAAVRHRLPVREGVGIWGINIPVGWGFAIVNFVWWIGIGHAGTLISAILLLLRQTWRNSINRFAEAMTLFAVACAGMFPLIHIGRPWLAYWLFPYPNTMGRAGRSSAARWCGTCSRSRPTSRSRCCSGSSA